MVLDRSPVVDGVVDSPVESLGSVRDAAEVLVFRPILPIPKLQWYYYRSLETICIDISMYCD